MLLHGHVYTASNGLRGVDTDSAISADAAAAFHAHGYRFAIRYVRREVAHERDLSAHEAALLLDAGLGIMAVQYVESERDWAPSGAQGAQNGATAAAEATAVGIPAGVTLWCDLEGVAPGTPANAVVAYCNQWHSAVAREGFVPGLYVGWHAGLNATQLYRTLRFTHYWGAYNLNADDAPSVRGVQMRQQVRRPVDVPVGVHIAFQTDVVRTDRLGGAPTLLAPDGWGEWG